MSPDLRYYLCFYIEAHPNPLLKSAIPNSLGCVVFERVPIIFIIMISKKYALVTPPTESYCYIIALLRYV